MTMPRLPELLLILAVVLLLFGGGIARRLMRNAGETIREFRRIRKEMEDGDDA